MVKQLITTKKKENKMDKKMVIKILDKQIPDHGYKVKDIAAITKHGKDDFQIEFGDFDFISITKGKVITPEF